jgi:hypothetical protein
MKTEHEKRYKKEYMIMVNVQFPLYFSKKEEDDGVEIPHELIVSEVNKCLESKDYSIEEESTE